MKSATLSRFGASGSNLRCTRSSGLGPARAMVVRLTLPRTTPTSPAAVISRSTL